MAKKNQIKKEEEEEVFMDFMQFDEDDDCSDDMVMNAMSGMIEASSNQMNVAMELTKLIVNNSPAKDIEEQVFSVFKKAVKLVGENFALKNLMEQFER